MVDFFFNEMVFVAYIQTIGSMSQVFFFEELFNGMLRHRGRLELHGMLGLHGKLELLGRLELHGKLELLGKLELHGRLGLHGKLEQHGWSMM